MKLALGKYNLDPKVAEPVSWDSKFKMKYISQSYFLKPPQKVHLRLTKYSPDLRKGAHQPRALNHNLRN